MAKKTKHYSEQEIQRAKELYLGGRRPDEVAEILGCHKNSVALWAKNGNWDAEIEDQIQFSEDMYANLQELRKAAMLRAMSNPGNSQLVFAVIRLEKLDLDLRRSRERESMLPDDERHALFFDAVQKIIDWLMVRDPKVAQGLGRHYKFLVGEYRETLKGEGNG